MSRMKKDACIVVTSAVLGASGGLFSKAENEEVKDTDLVNMAIGGGVGAVGGVLFVAGVRLYKYWQSTQDEASQPILTRGQSCTVFSTPVGNETVKNLADRVPPAIDLLQNKYMTGIKIIDGKTDYAESIEVLRKYYNHPDATEFTKQTIKDLFDMINLPLTPSTVNLTN